MHYGSLIKGFCVLNKFKQALLIAEYFLHRLLSGAIFQFRSISVSISILRNAEVYSFADIPVICWLCFYNSSLLAAKWYNLKNFYNLKDLDCICVLSFLRSVPPFFGLFTSVRSQLRVVISVTLMF